MEQKLREWERVGRVCSIRYVRYIFGIHLLDESPFSQMAGKWKMHVLCVCSEKKFEFQYQNSSWSIELEDEPTDSVIVEYVKLCLNV